MENSKIVDLRLAAFAAVMFFSCARNKEAANVKLSNVKETEEGNVKIVFVKAKNNQFGQPRPRVIAKIDGEYCPVKIILFYHKLIMQFQRRLQLEMSMIGTYRELVGGSVTRPTRHILWRQIKPWGKSAEFLET